MENEKKQKRIDYIQEMIFKYTMTEPKLNEEEIIFAVCFHLCHEEGLKAISKIIKKLRKELNSKF